MDLKPPTDSQDDMLNAPQHQFFPQCPSCSNCRTVWLQEATEIRDVEYIVIISKQTQVEQSLIFFHRPLGEKRAKASTRISY